MPSIQTTLETWDIASPIIYHIYIYSGYIYHFTFLLLVLLTKYFSVTHCKHAVYWKELARDHFRDKLKGHLRVTLEITKNHFLRWGFSDHLLLHTPVSGYTNFRSCKYQGGINMNKYKLISIPQKINLLAKINRLRLLNRLRSLLTPKVIKLSCFTETCSIYWFILFIPYLQLTHLQLEAGIMLYTN